MARVIKGNSFDDGQFPMPPDPRGQAAEQVVDPAFSGVEPAELQHLHGAGQARVWPIVNDAGRSLVVLHLEAPQGELVGEVLTTQLDRFLGRTTGLVPLGTEREHLDLDGVIEQLLTSGSS